MKVKRFSRSEIKITQPIIKFKSPSPKSEKPKEVKEEEDEDEENYYED